jgi:hypothetical protein
MLTHPKIAKWLCIDHLLVLWLKPRWMIDLRSIWTIQWDLTVCYDEDDQRSQHKSEK